MIEQVVTSPRTAAISLAGLSLFSSCASTSILPMEPITHIAAQSTSLEISPPIVEVGVSDSGVRVRSYLDAQYDLSNLAITFHGFHEGNFGDLDYFYGRETVGIKPKGFSQELVAVTEFNQDGYLDTHFGIRDTALPKLLGGYGFEHLVANDESMSFLAFFGHNLLPTDCAKPLNLEILQRCDLQYEGVPSYYSELQLTKMLFENVGIFARLEVPDFDLDSKATVFGLTAIF